MWLSVTQTPEGTNGLINLPINEVLFLEFDSSEGWILVHTRTKRYYLAGTLAYWAKSLEQYDFEKVDRNIVVQVPMIQRMDTQFFLAYFDNEVTEKSKRVTMSQKYFKRIVRRIKTSQMGVSVV